MLEENSFDINLDKIIDNERFEVPKYSLTDDEGSTFYSKIQDEFFARGRVIKRGEGRIDFEKKEENFIRANTYIELLILRYFIVNDKLYPFNEPLQISINHLEFDYFFAFTLRQFENKLKHIKNLLNHYNDLFEKSGKDFKTELEILLLQYKDRISEDVILLSQKWLLNNQDSVTKEQNAILEIGHNRMVNQTENVIKRKRPKADIQFNSFQLIKPIDKTDENVIKIFTDLRGRLKNAKFLKKAPDDIQEFINIFTNNFNRKGTPFQWRSLKSLHCFVKLMLDQDELNLIEEMKNDKWLVCTKIFHIKIPNDIETKKLVVSSRYSEKEKNQLQTILEETLCKI